MTTGKLKEVCLQERENKFSLIKELIQTQRKMSDLVISANMCQNSIQTTSFNSKSTLEKSLYRSTRQDSRSSRFDNSGVLSPDKTS